MKVGKSSNYFMLIPVKGFSLDGLEKDLVIQALEKSQYNKSEAARMLGISRARLRYKLRKFNIKS